MSKKRRPLRFALSGALLVPGLLGTACGPDNDDATMNVALPPEGEEAPVTDSPPPHHPPPTGNVAVMHERPPVETANPVGDDLPPVEEPEDETEEEEPEPPPSPMRTNVR
ncbi:MAG: hypothetical protein JJ863_25930 [Deltaproteobacteria bacterium]|nr:hypothetical protein [Deltaproteobacteria bacterium]